MKKLISTIGIVFIAIMVAWLSNQPQNQNLNIHNTTSASVRHSAEKPAAVSHFNLEEQQAIESTLNYIDSGTVPPEPLSRKWGANFNNYEQKLPSNVSYREYRVSPAPGINGAGPRRIVVSSNGAVYYTSDHYESFKRIR